MPSYSDKTKEVLEDDGVFSYPILKCTKYDPFRFSPVGVSLIVFDRKAGIFK
jgi:hypothetical protein